MTDADFLAAVCADPDADGPRLIYADWLDERGDPRGEFIRVQVELADWRAQLNRFVKDHGDRRLAYLRRRERELGSRYAIDWIPPAPAGWVAWRTDGPRAGWWPTDLQGVARPEDHGVDFDFRRGFVEAVTLDGPAWRDHGDALRLAAPLRQVRLATWPEEVWASGGRMRVVSEGGVHIHFGDPVLGTRPIACDLQIHFDRPPGIAGAVRIGPEHGPGAMLRALHFRWPGLAFELPPAPHSRPVSDAIRDDDR